MTDAPTPASAEPRWPRTLAVAGLLVVSLLATLPFWETLRPPLQDLPQHLAAARVLLDRAHPGFRFEELFDVDWLRSQYLGTYVLLGVFFYPLRLVLDEPLLWASRCLLVSLALAWPLSAELLYRRLGHRVGLGALALVCFFNAHLILGFLSFLLGIVACLLALALLAGARARERLGRPQGAHLFGWGLAALCCFYLHVVPFALLGLVLGVTGCAEHLWPALRARRGHGLGRFRRWLSSARLRPYLAFLPALASATAWLFTPAGASTREAARGSGARGRAVYASVESNAAELSRWLVDAFASPWDTRWAALALGVFSLWLLVEQVHGAWARRGVAPIVPSEPIDSLMLWTLRAFVPLSFALYFALPTSYDWIWPINARFPLFGLMFLPLWLPAPGSTANAALRVFRGLALTSLLAAAALEALVARHAFAGFAREMAGFDRILDSIPPGQRAAALVFDRGSRHVAFAPFLHLGAYYQAERGGLAVFSFADFPQSPIRFRAEGRPPRMPPRWEWTPDKVRLDRDLGYFDVVITRGGSARLERSQAFELAERVGPYRLFRKRREGSPK